MSVRKQIRGQSVRTDALLWSRAKVLGRSLGWTMPQIVEIALRLFLEKFQEHAEDLDMYDPDNERRLSELTNG